MKNNHWLSPEWPAPANIHAATTLRTGGVSLAPYNSLNPASHVGDNAEHVRENRQRIKSLLKLPAEPLWLQQTHSNQAVYAQANSITAIADASYTDQANVVCAVMTADCLPLLGCSADGLQIAAIHAGWRGLLDGIISNTIGCFATKDLLVWLGPAIGKHCFEVGQDVYSAFAEKSAVFSSAFTASANDKYLADIYQLARIELQALGIKQIYGGDFCTVTDSDRFFSYRRDQQTGRMATLIWRD